MNAAHQAINVLYIASRGDSGAGGENYLLTLFRNIDRSRYTPFVVLPNDGSLRQPLEDLGIEVIVVEADYSWLQPDIAWYEVIEGLQSRVKTLSTIIENFDISIVHTNSNLRFEGALAARLSGVRHLYLAHIEYQPDMPIFQRLPLALPSFAQLMLGLSDSVVAVSESVAATLRTDADSTPIKVIHNGLELAPFDQALASLPNTLRQELGISDSDILICAVGRIAVDKGFDYLVEAANTVLKGDATGVHFIIVGSEESAEHAAHLKSKVANYGIGDQFHFIGFRSDVPVILASSDIFVLSSRKEGHPYVMLEAMASKCAVVASNCAGVEETIENGSSGFIVNIGDVAAMAEHLRQLIDSKSLRTSTGNEARKTIERSFTADKTANALMQRYQQLLLLPQKPAGSYPVEFFMQGCTEIGYLGRRNIELEKRLRRVEHLADLIQNNFLSKSLRALKHFFKG